MCSNPPSVYLYVVTRVQCCRCYVISPIKIKIVTHKEQTHNTICYLLLLARPMNIMCEPQIFCDHRRVSGDRGVTNARPGPKWVIGPCQGNAPHKYLKLTQAQQLHSLLVFVFRSQHFVYTLVIMTRAHGTRLWQTIKTVSWLFPIEGTRVKTGGGWQGVIVSCVRSKQSFCTLLHWHVHFYKDDVYKLYPYVNILTPSVFLTRTETWCRRGNTRHAGARGSNAR